MTNRVAFISVHECPLASSEGKERGGINVYTYELGKALAARGWDVDAFTRIQDDTNPRIVQVTEGFRVIHLPNGPHTSLSKKQILSSLPEFTQSFKDFMKKEQITYDILHAHYYLSGLVALEMNNMFATPVPIVMTFHTMGLMKQLVARGNTSEDPDSRVSLERNIAATVPSIITSSETGKQYLSSFYDCPEEKIHVIPPGVDTTLFRPLKKESAREHIGMDSRERMILAVGRIDPVKGFDVLLAAMKILLHRRPDLGENICLCIVGGDVEQTKQQWSRELKKLDDLRSSLHLTTTVRFVPPQPQEELPYYYSAADVVVMPSHYESFGMVALEAIACGTPVIATDVTGISHILKEVPQGHVVSANNPVLLASEIEHVLSTPHEKIGTSPKIQSFDWGRIAGRIADEYRRVYITHS